MELIGIELLQVLKTDKLLIRRNIPQCPGRLKRLHCRIHCTFILLWFVPKAMPDVISRKFMSGLATASV